MAGRLDAGLSRIETITELSQQAAVAETGNFPGGDAVAGQHGGKQEIHDVGFGGAEAARGG